MKARFRMELPRWSLATILRATFGYGGIQSMVETARRGAELEPGKALHGPRWCASRWDLAYICLERYRRPESRSRTLFH